MSARNRKSVARITGDLVWIPRTLHALFARRVALTPSRRSSGTFRHRP